MRKIFSSAFLLGLMILSFQGFSQVATSSSSQILHQMHALKNTTKVLYVAAHPDDENTRLISYLTQYKQVDVSYLSLTRGDGGQNLIGTEIGEGLGLIRTYELLAARKIDGGHQHFTRAVDFGYSKTADESFSIWDKDAVLSDVVWVIRNTKPDVVITRFSPEENPDRPTHGHHTASAKLALLAFDYAADPTKYPEQLKYVSVHKTQKIYWNTSHWFFSSKEKMEEEVAKNPTKYIKMDVNQLLPLTGHTCSEISANSRSQHKSQGFGSAPALEEQLELLQILKGDPSENDMFTGSTAGWLNLPNGKAINKTIQQIISSYQVDQPWNSVNSLLVLKALIEKLPADQIALRTRKLAEVNELIVSCLGLRATAFVKERKYVANSDILVNLNIQNYAHNVQLKLAKVSIPSLGINENFADLSVNQTGMHKELKGQIPATTKHTQPFWLSGLTTLGSYAVPYIHATGMDVEPYAFQTTLSVSINGKVMEVVVPVMFSTTDPVKGQVIQPITIIPDVMLNLDKEVYVFTGNQPKNISVEVISGLPGLDGYVELNLPKGWSSSPTFIKCKLGTKGEKQTYTFAVTAPEQQESSTVRAMFKTEESVYTNGLKEIAYDHIPHMAWFPTSESAIRKIDLQKRGSTVGYVMGAGDKVPEALAEMGYQVTMITVSDILQKPLNYDAILFGIRAYNTIDDIENTYAVLMKYIEKGGNVVVQYNTSQALKSKKIGPYDLNVSRERVTEEVAEVRILKPDHVVVNSPNKIDNSDFENWVQERGLYFPNQWDQKYDAILSMNDTGEKPNDGSLLVAKYGEGYFIYTGISFFRELPAGVPGAYRLMANLLSL